jgi:hypothetical protein
MSNKFDLVRLADIRDAHLAVVSDYQRSILAVSDAAIDASRARLDAPPLMGEAQPAPRAAYAPGIGLAPKQVQPRARTNEFYLQPLATLLSFSDQQLEDASIDRRALSQIVVAENRLTKLRSAHATKAAAVRESAAAMKNINLFALENQL